MGFDSMLSLRVEGLYNEEKLSGKGDDGKGWKDYRKGRAGRKGLVASHFLLWHACQVLCSKGIQNLSAEGRMVRRSMA
jgi:hypothetical protein